MTKGITIAAATKAVRVERDGVGWVLVGEQGGRERRFGFDRLLVALGRRANVTGFGLAELGVRVRGDGTIDADPLQRTNFPNILVCGDATGPFQLTHVASHQACYAAVNGVLAPLWSYRADDRVIPWCTFTEPQVACVGLSEDEARAQGVAVEVTRYGPTSTARSPTAPTAAS